jgi:hypothetical protein
MMDRPFRLGHAWLLTLTLTLAVGLLVVGSPARACSCAPTDLDAWLPEADGALVGRWVDRADVGNGDAAVTFEVERVLKGFFGPKAIVRTNAQGSACGLELLGDDRTGLLLRRAADGVWESDLCSMVPAGQLLAVGGDRPPDPEIAAVSAGWSLPLKGLLGALAAAWLALLVLARYARRGAAKQGETDVT